MPIGVVSTGKTQMMFEMVPYGRQSEDIRQNACVPIQMRELDLHKFCVWYIFSLMDPVRNAPQETNISPEKSILKMNVLLPKRGMRVVVNQPVSPIIARLLFAM